LLVRPSRLTSHFDMREDGKGIYPVVVLMVATAVISLQVQNKVTGWRGIGALRLLPKHDYLGSLKED
jgi:hypothetical protein